MRISVWRQGSPAGTRTPGHHGLPGRTCPRRRQAPRRPGAAAEDPGARPIARSSRGRNRSSSTRRTCRRPATRWSTTPRASRRSCARRCSSPASIPTSPRENVGYFTGAATQERAKLGKPVIDRAGQGGARHAAERREAARRSYLGDQGCVTLPPGRTTVNFTPVAGQEQAARSRRRSRGRWATCCRRIRCRPGSTRPR